MASHSQVLTMSLPSELTWLSVARDFVHSACRAGNFNESDTHAIVLASNEAVSNVIRHAHAGRCDVRVELECRIAADSMEVHIHDHGAPFELDKVPHLDPADIRLGGRGVYLMRILMDELCCEPLGEHGNHLRMVKFRRGGVNAEPADTRPQAG